MGNVAHRPAGDRLAPRGRRAARSPEEAPAFPLYLVSLPLYEVEWETVIGLEIHAQLATRSKIFSGASTAYGAAPNTQACAGRPRLPGRAAGAQREAVRMAVIVRARHRRDDRAALGVRAQELLLSRPAQGLPDQPVRAAGGAGRPLEIVLDDGGRQDHRHHPRAPRGGRRQVAARGLPRHDRHRPEPRRHAAAGDRLRARHALGEGGGGLHEEAAHAGALPRHLRRQHAGGLVPLRRQRLGAPQGPARVRHPREIKNLNSFRFVERAIELRGGAPDRHPRGRRQVVQETRLYDPDRGETRSMRSKEEANDYRYFPDPDLLPLEIEDGWIEPCAARCRSCRTRSATAS
jgi:aspartyl-tRNA(Asn)/glutamyl-tRNA(Gln) amidotransferase subunit B